MSVAEVVVVEVRRGVWEVQINGGTVYSGKRGGALRHAEKSIERGKTVGVTSTLSIRPL